VQGREKVAPLAESIWRDTPCTCYNNTTRYTTWPPKQESV